MAATTNPSRPGHNLTYPTTNTYDALGRLVAVTVQDGSSIKTSCSSPMVTSTDQAGVARRNTYDALGRLVRVQEDPSGANIQTTYQYDALNNLVGVNQAGRIRSFAYDSLSRLQQVSNPATTLSSVSGCSREQGGEVRGQRQQQGGRDVHFGPYNDTVNQQFTGKERDFESGLDYFGARYYGSALGRFTSLDEFKVAS